MTNTRTLRLSAEERAAQRWEAEQDEHARFNAACTRGGPALLQTESGLLLVWKVTPDWWYVCDLDDATAPSIAGQNDGTWAALLRQVGEARHSFFAANGASRNGKR
jgi:hypothetical protein